ncbi:MAG: hypothetical protein RSD88_01125 [Anaerovoracaceae bacterium]
MSCFGNRPASDIYENCCKGSHLCEFSGDLDDIVSAPIYTQSVYDAVMFNLQGMKTVQNQRFCPDIPCGHSVSRVVDIRCKRVFNPHNVDDPRNLCLDVDTSISGATFLQDCHGDPLKVVGPDGTLSQKILYADPCPGDEEGLCTPIFGTQNIGITGNVIVYVDLLLCDDCNHERVFTVWAEVTVATAAHPLMLTNFFEISMPSVTEATFLPRFTELNNTACECRLATNNCGRDIIVNCDGEVTGNLIVALCVTCEKKVVLPVQLCVLSSGLVDVPTQTNPICTSFPSLFPNPGENCNSNCDHQNNHGHHGHNDCNPCSGPKIAEANPCDCGCKTGCSDCAPPAKPKPKPPKPEPCDCDPCGGRPRR